ncbi:hypothetical protein [Methylobacterium sp. ID0610]|uniref:hypothetical protein n=1 Tax=Methylobacterium carpenticola TaxID=3344827 RepID=UPI00368D16E5
MQFTAKVRHDEAPALDELVAVIEDVVPDLIAANVPDDVVGTQPKIPVSIQHVVNAKRVDA